MKNEKILMVFVFVLMVISLIEAVVIFNLGKQRDLIFGELKGRSVSESSLNIKEDCQSRIKEIEKEKTALAREKSELWRENVDLKKEVEEINTQKKEEVLSLYQEQYNQLQEGSLEKAHADYLIRVELPEYLADILKRGFTMKVLKQEGIHWKGHVDRHGIEDHSGPSVLAVKLEDGWRVVSSGSDSPLCQPIEKYNFPASMVPRCFDEAGEWIKRD